ncbi:MAG TPA: DNA mismatch repair protein, partial [Epsilonproteobacteria bacterium]|nr:DNA mismatch repair protein [Campylobacterota bacterium]
YELGTFFEVYEVDNDEMQIGKAKEISELLNIQLTRKSKTILTNNLKNPLMAGVPAVSFDRFLARVIAEDRYTIVIIRQRGAPPKVSRYLDRIISPGTNFDFIHDNEANYATSLVVEENNGIYLIGYAAIDISTGKTLIYEAQGNLDDKTLAFDEVFSLMHANRTKEVVITFAHKDIKQEEVLSYLEIDAHYSSVINTHRQKITYQNELFKSVYKIESLLSPIEHLDLEFMPLVSESLAILVDFIIDHDLNIVQKLSLPVMINSKSMMFLGNNAIEQLQIISKDPDEMTVYKLINNTATSMGRRLLRDRLLYPQINKQEIGRRYKLSEKISEQHKLLFSKLNKIYDIERLTRRLALNKLHPCELNYLYDSLIAVKEMHAIVEQLKIDTTLYDFTMVVEFIADVERVFDLDKTAKFNYNQIDENVVLPGINPELDSLVNENETLVGELEKIADVVRQTLSETLGKEIAPNFVKVDQTEKSGFFIDITKSRYTLIADTIKSKNVMIGEQRIFFDEFYFKQQTNNVKITGAFIDEISTKVLSNQSKIIALTKKLYREYLEIFDKKYSPMMTSLGEFVGDLDVAVSNIITAKKYNYAKPEIVDSASGKNFIQQIGLRHPLIEVQEEHGIYVPNNIIMGDPKLVDDAYRDNILSSTARGEEVRGILLYGINSSGKSSLMKSIGISVIMAQAGLFVPAEKMKFTIFESIFTRIVSKDNLMKGMSTFAVEMTELRNIFNRVNTKSLVIGDELSHGTETLSGVSLVASALMKLNRLECLHIFATHLHQLTELKQINAIKPLICMHLSVTYDLENDKLIYNRTLQPGNGSTVYGLEFAKSLHMDKEFIKDAEDIRKQLANEYSSLELLSKKRQSKYNKDLFVASCVICGKEATESHHIIEQHVADQNGYYNHVPMNHKYNLLPLCEKHHKQIHQGKIIVHGFVMTSEGLKLEYEEKE